MIAPTVGHAFCGTYVGQPGEELYAHTSQVLMVREEGRTTLTLTNDYEGDLTEFAMLVPVPSLLTESDVSLADPRLIDRFAEYTGPRLVEYECSDFWYDEWDDYDYHGGGGCGFFGDDAADTDMGTDMEPSAEALQVEVESEFVVGAYQLVVLSSEDAKDLLTWLEREGYGVDAAAEEMLGEYIEDGSYFLAAKVSLDEVPAVGSYLPPITLSYDSPSFGLPIRLGTLNSAGSQDLVVYAVTDLNEGRVGIANYPEVRFDDECMPRGVGPDDLGDYILEQFDGAVAEAGGAGWTLEYGWASSWCDPCPPGGAVSESDLRLAGFTGSSDDAYVTRLRMQYTPETASEDLVLYSSGHPGNDQIRYILHSTSLESDFPICGEGFGTGSCDTSANRTRRSGLPWWPIGLVGLVGVLGWGVRRFRR